MKFVLFLLALFCCGCRTDSSGNLSSYAEPFAIERIDFVELRQKVQEALVAHSNQIMGKPEFPSPTAVWNEHNMHLEGFLDWVCGDWSITVKNTAPNVFIVSTNIINSNGDGVMLYMRFINIKSYPLLDFTFGPKEDFESLPHIAPKRP